MLSWSLSLGIVGFIAAAAGLGLAAVTAVVITRLCFFLFVAMLVIALFASRQVSA